MRECCNLDQGNMIRREIQSGRDFHEQMMGQSNQRHVFLVGTFPAILENLDKANEVRSVTCSHSPHLQLLTTPLSLKVDRSSAYRCRDSVIAVGIVVQVIAGTARGLQMRHREKKNTLLDQSIRSCLCYADSAMVVVFKDKVSEYSNPVPTKPKFKRGLDSVRLVSGKTHEELELSDAAALVYPDLDRVAAQAVRSEGDMGTSSGMNGLQEKYQGAGEWVSDYMNRKAEVIYETEHPGSSFALSASAENRASLKSRLNNPNHPAANSGH
ncbi:hypothetical protein N7460_002625 [Penicillium canescens]|uniref:Uncharacterized protein n=2 Tax=Penicillium canescens TaxID=5083 RepID=A0AAD6NCY3_PENCN|nr:hypothetical protein N7460_002625 [Penicillium canescens]